MSIELTLAESIGATSVTLTYYDGENLSADSVTGAVSNNTVTLKVSNSYANEWAFENMKLEITGTNTDNLTMSSADSNFGGNSDKFWFKFESDSTLAVTVNRDVSSDNTGESTENETLPYTATSFPFEKSYTGTGSNETFLTKESFANVSGTTVTVAFTWASGSGDPWFGVGDSWPTVSWDGSIASGTTTVEELKSNDLVIGAPTGAGFTVTISIE